MHAIPAPRVQLDPSRIASISGAIAVNGLLLLLLIAPMSPVIRQAADEAIPLDFIRKRETPPPPPPPIDPPIHVTVTTPAPTVHQQAPAVDPPPLEIDDPQPGDIQMPPITSDNVVADSGIVTPPDDGTPLKGAHLEYAANPAPAYPSSALRAQEQGTVLLEVLVDVDGRPIEVKVSRSSGSRALDLAARKQVLANWTFRPATRNGVAVEAIGIVPVEFKLN